MPAPSSCAIRTLTPQPIPIRKPVNSVTRSVVEPTAPQCPVVIRNRPTTASSLIKQRASSTWGKYQQAAQEKQVLPRSNLLSFLYCFFVFFSLSIPCKSLSIHRICINMRFFRSFFLDPYLSTILAGVDFGKKAPGRRNSSRRWLICGFKRITFFTTARRFHCDRDRVTHLHLILPGSALQTAFPHIFWI